MNDEPQTGATQPSQPSVPVLRHPLSIALNWMIRSTWFKKWSNTIGSIAFGMWLSGRYWREIRDTLAVWGIERDEWMGFLVAVIAASGIAMSFAASIAKQRKEKRAP